MIQFLAVADTYNHFYNHTWFQLVVLPISILLLIILGIMLVALSQAVFGKLFKSKRSVIILPVIFFLSFANHADAQVRYVYSKEYKNEMLVKLFAGLAKDELKFLNRIGVDASLRFGDTREIVVDGKTLYSVKVEADGLLFTKHVYDASGLQRIGFEQNKITPDDIEYFPEIETKSVAKYGDMVFKKGR